MFEAIKKYFGKGVKMEAKPIEINPTVPMVLSRNEARLARLLTIKDPTDEIKAEIERRQKDL